MSNPKTNNHPNLKHRTNPSNMSQPRCPLRASKARLAARLEAHLSTYAFTHLFILFYLSAVVLTFLWGLHTELVHPPTPRAMRPFIALARGFGYTLNLNTALVLLLAARLFLTKLRATPVAHLLALDRAFPALHILVAYLIGFAAVFHAAFHFVWLIRWDFWRWGWFNHNMSVITGILLLVVFVVMFVFSLPRIRKKHFRLFHAAHIACAALFYPILLLHGVFRARPETYKWVLLPLVLYLLDRIIRRLRISSTELYLSAENPEHHILKDADVLELRVPKPFNYRAGQYAEICVPDIGHEWHPFTIATAPHEDNTVFYIKALGDWTNELHHMYQQRLDAEVTDPLRVQVRGPFGAPAQHTGSYERVVLISGGIGSTPFASICKDLHYRQVEEQKSRKRAQQKSDGNEKLDDDCLKDQLVGIKMTKYEERVRSAISTLYGVDIGGEQPKTENDEQRALHVTNMLQMTSAGEEQKVQGPEQTNRAGIQSALSPHSSGPTTDASNNEIMTVTEDSDSFSERSTSCSSASTFLGVEDEEVPVSGVREGVTESNDPVAAASRSGMGKKKSSARTLKNESNVIVDFSSSAPVKRSVRHEITHLHEARSKFLAFLHSTRVIFFLLATLIARIFLVSVGSIFDSEFVRVTTGPETIETGMWVVIADTVLGVFLAIVLPMTILLELSFMGWRYFRTAGRCVDMFIFLPLTILCAVLGVRTCITREPEGQLVSVLHYIMFVPLLFFLLASRMYRSIGNRQLLVTAETKHKADCCKCGRSKRGKKIPSVDFIWATPHEAEDAWLRRELDVLETGTEVRLHRYVTRVKEVDLEGGEGGYMSSVSAGRPQWGDILREVGLGSRSDSVVGVFFCGPPKMQEAVQKAVRQAEIESHLRGAYLRGSTDEMVMREVGVRGSVGLRALREKGCGVRFVFRYETFG